MSGYTSARRYRAATVFFRMLGFECDSLGNKSDRRERAKEEVMMCGNVTRGKDIVGGRGEDISCAPSVEAHTSCCELHTFFSKFVASIKTSVSGRKL